VSVRACVSVYSYSYKHTYIHTLVCNRRGDNRRVINPASVLLAEKLCQEAHQAEAKRCGVWCGVVCDEVCYIIVFLFITY
jgi:hypothetical protein